MVCKACPAVRRNPQAEAFNGFGSQTAGVYEIVKSLSAVGSFQVLIEELCSLAVHLQNPLFGLRGAVFKAVLRHCNAGFFRQILNRLHVIKVFYLHGEGYNVPSGTAAEAIKAAVVGINGAGRSALGMKRTQAFISMPTPLKGNILPHYIFDAV